MKRKDIYKLIELDSEFNSECVRIKKFLKNLLEGGNISQADTFKIQSASVYWSGGYTISGGFQDPAYGTFPIELLMYSDEELQEYVESENEKTIKKRRDEEERIKAARIETKQRELERKETEYEALRMEIEKLKKEIEKGKTNVEG